MDPKSFIVSPILTVLMFELGLTLKLQDFKLFKDRPLPVLAGLIGQIVVLPALAWFIGRAFGFDPVFLFGFMLIACCPGGPSSNVFSMLAKGDVALSVSLTACSSIITLFTVPFIMELVTTATSEASEVKLPVFNLFLENIVMILVPIIVGIVVRKHWDSAAEKIHKVLSKVAFPALIFVAAMFFFANSNVIIDNFGKLSISITMLILLAMATGLLLSWIMRLNTKERRTIIIEIGMQNAMQAITIATVVLNNAIYAIPAIIYALMMNVILIIYVAVVKRR